MHPILFVPASISGHLGYFHLSVLVNNAAVNMGMQISVKVCAVVVFKTGGKTFGQAPCFAMKPEMLKSSQCPQPGMGLGSQPEALGLCALVGTLHHQVVSVGYNSDLSSLHSYALCFLYKREASLDGICRVSRRRSYHQILSEGRTLTAPLAAAAVMLRSQREAQLLGVAPHHGKCTRLVLVLPDKIR